MKKFCLCDIKTQLRNKKGGGVMQTVNKILKEIEYTIAPKIWNYQHGTASEREIEIIKECLAFRSLILYSNLPIKEIKRLWENSGISYQ